MLTHVYLADQVILYKPSKCPSLLSRCCRPVETVVRPVQPASDGLAAVQLPRRGSRAAPCRRWSREGQPRTIEPCGRHREPRPSPTRSGHSGTRRTYLYQVETDILMTSHSTSNTDADWMVTDWLSLQHANTNTAFKARMHARIDSVTHSLCHLFIHIQTYIHSHIHTYSLTRTLACSLTHDANRWSILGNIFEWWIISYSFTLKHCLPHLKPQHTVRPLETRPHLS